METDPISQIFSLLLSQDKILIAVLLVCLVVIWRRYTRMTDDRINELRERAELKERTTDSHNAIRAGLRPSFRIPDDVSASPAAPSASMLPLSILARQAMPGFSGMSVL